MTQKLKQYQSKAMKPLDPKTIILIAFLLFFSKTFYGQADFSVVEKVKTIKDRTTFKVVTISTYQSRKPITYPIDIYYIIGQKYVNYSSRNIYNIPEYFRIDTPLTVEGNLLKKKFIHSSLMLSVFYLTGRKKPYSIFFKLKDGIIRCYKCTVIGVPLVTITWLFKFGNYESD